MITMRSPIASTLLLAGALALVAPSCQQLQAGSSSSAPGATTRPEGAEPKVPATMNPTAAWKEIDRLLDEQKLSEAADRLEPLVESARATGDEANWARALVRQSQVRTSLGGLETAVEEMKAQPWPPGSVARAAVELYYAHALLEYLSGYDWEIRQRERVVSDEKVDLKAWTAEQIAAEAERSFLAVWERREELGSVAVGDFPYLQANDFPKGIRDSLRDAVSYLFVERLLGDSSFWSASEANDAWQLDLGNLLAERPDVPAGAVHPLLRAVAVLADLEQWHRGRRELGAELQAYLHREALLSEHRQGEEDRRRRREALEQRLPRFRGDPWWSMGVYSLAQDLDQVASDPERRIRARALALEGERAYPGTHGAQRCRQLIAQIESPDYQLQSMTVDGADRRSIEITHRNLAQLHLRAYPIDLAAELSRNEFRGLFPNDDREIERLLAAEPAAAEWKVALPPTADYLPHRTFATPPLTRPEPLPHRRLGGALVRQAGQSPRGAAVHPVGSGADRRECEHPLGGARSSRGATAGAPAGVEVALYRNTWREAPTRISAVRTDAAGRATFAFPGESGYSNFLVVARRGDDIAVAQRYGGQPQPGVSPYTSSLLFTDRAIYRPEQKLYWKVLAYESGRGRGELTPAPETPVEVSLTDPNGEKVAAVTVTTNRFGTAAGEFEIPAGRPARPVDTRDLARRRDRGARRGVQAPDVRGRGRRSGARAAPQPAGRAQWRGTLLLRPAGHLRSRRLAGDPPAGASLVVALLGLRRRLHRGAGDRERHDGARCGRPVPDRVHPGGGRKRQGEGLHLSLSPRGRHHRRRRRDAHRRAHGAARLGGGRSARREAGRPRGRESAVRDLDPPPGPRTARRAPETGSWRLLRLEAPSRRDATGRSAAASGRRAPPDLPIASRPRATGCARAGPSARATAQTLALFADGRRSRAAT